MKVKEKGLGLILVRNTIGLLVITVLGYMLLQIGASIEPRPWGYEYAASIMVLAWILTFLFGLLIPLGVLIYRWVMRP